MTTDTAILLLIAELRGRVAELETENAALHQRLAASQPDGAEPEPGL